MGCLFLKQAIDEDEGSLFHNRVNHLFGNVDKWENRMISGSPPGNPDPFQKYYNNLITN